MSKHPRPLFYAVVELTGDTASIGRTFKQIRNARKVARRRAAVLTAKFPGHAGLSILERYDGS